VVQQKDIIIEEGSILCVRSNTMTAVVMVGVEGVGGDLVMVVDYNGMGNIAYLEDLT